MCKLFDRNGSIFLHFCKPNLSPRHCDQWISDFFSRPYFGLTTIFPGAPLYHQFIVKQPLDGIIPDQCVMISAAGIAEREVPNGPQLYPNPATDLLTVESNWPRIQDVDVLNSLGQVVLRQAIRNGTATMDVSALPNAVYVIRAQGPEGSTYARFVKQ